MTGRPSTNSDEIDLFGLFETIWDGRFILVGFLAAALAISGLFLAVNEEKYNTYADYYIELSPPFVDESEIRSDIVQVFRNEGTFASWKAGHSGKSLGFDLIDDSLLIQGAAFGLEEDTRFVSFEASRIRVQSNDIQLIFEVLEYFEFVGVVLEQRYHDEAKRERGRYRKLETELLSKLNTNDALPTIENIAALDRYLEKAAGGQGLIRNSRPLPPQKVGISTNMVLLLAIICGGFSGSIFLLFKKAHSIRNSRLLGIEG